MIHPAHRAKFRQSMLWFLLLLGSLGLVKVFPAPDAARGVAGYVPLHTAMEVVAIAMVGMVFGISWVTQKYRANGRALVLGLGLLGVGLLDLSHSLSYAGMPDYVTPLCGLAGCAAARGGRALRAAGAAAVGATHLPARVGADALQGEF